jgi:hypothetical protein
LLLLLLLLCAAVEAHIAFSSDGGQPARLNQYGAAGQQAHSSMHGQGEGDIKHQNTSLMCEHRCMLVVTYWAHCYEH